MASSFVYDVATAGWGNGLLCLRSSTTASFYVTLLSNNYVPNPAHSFASNFSGAELSGGAGYSAGYNGSLRISLTTRTVFSNTVSHQAEYRAADVSWLALNGGTAHAYAILQQGGTDGNSPLIVYCSLGGFPLITSGGSIAISFANSGIFQLQDA